MGNWRRPTKHEIGGINLIVAAAWLADAQDQRELPIRQPPCAREEPMHAGAVYLGLGQQLDTMALERGDHLRPHLAADMVGGPVPRANGRLNLQPAGFRRAPSVA